MRHLISDLRGNPIYTSFGSWRSRNGNLASSSRSNTAQYNPRAILFLHVRSSDWNAVIQRVKTHPLDVLMIDDNGNTPLHIACQLDPPAEVLVSLKEAVEQTNSWGATPLHIAASHRCNAQTLKQLIDFFSGCPLPTVKNASNPNSLCMHVLSGFGFGCLSSFVGSHSR